MPPGVSRRLLTAMKYVTKPGGTCSRADVVGYSEAGKSGTCKKNFDGKYSEIYYRATFIGITPTSRPRFVILVGMDEPKYGYVPGIGKYHNGGVCCAIVFNKLAKRVLEYAEVAPDDPASLPKTDRRYKAGKRDWYEENQILQKLY
jgi:cell division protein FtsI (penicillin-binding protein 3)